MDQRPAREDPLSQGQRVGNYRLERVLGQGTFGTVYLAVHTDIGKRAAIKVLNPPYAQDPSMEARFKNEARAVNHIQHPGIVNIFDFGRLPSGVAYFAMDFLDGVSLEERIQQPLLPGDALRICREIALALQAAHHLQIIHRDLKPQNIMLVRDPVMPSGDRVKVLDFGIAKLASSLDGEPVEALTQTGVSMGTPHYMAPEQWRSAGRVTDRADVYALGVILYRMLAGQLPFVGPGPALSLQHAAESPPALRELCPFLTPDLSALVHRMLSKESERRPAMGEVAEELTTFFQRSDPGAPPTVDHIPLQVLQVSQPRATSAPASGRALVLAAALVACGLMTLSLAIRSRSSPQPPSLTPAAAMAASVRGSATPLLPVHPPGDALPVSADGRETAHPGGARSAEPESKPEPRPSRRRGKLRGAAVVPLVPLVE